MQLYKTNLVLVVQKPNSKGELKYANITLQDLSDGLTQEQIQQLIDAFKTLLKYTVMEASIVNYSYVI